MLTFIHTKEMRDVVGKSDLFMFERDRMRLAGGGERPGGCFSARCYVKTEVYCAGEAIKASARLKL